MMVQPCATTSGPARLLERDVLSSPMASRLGAAAARLERYTDPSGPWALRPEQREVVGAFRDYLRQRADPSAARSAFCCIVLPPRTGKTVIAGELIRATGLTTTVLVPTRTLARQTARLLASMLPEVPVGLLTTEAKSTVGYGVNVTTYAMAQLLGAAGLPDDLRRSGLVFADEAHRTLTPARLELLRSAFDPAAVRVGLTATPDYDADRRLRHHYPEVIHELSLAEAQRLRLLAPARVWIAEVDREASHVKLHAGEYDPATLGRLMSDAPFFEAARRFRHRPESAAKGAVICCATRQQAHELGRYLAGHAPAGARQARVLLGETPAAERDDVLARFERGEVDTLIQVGVLIEGWSSPRCKLLIDLAPSASRVRATQKYFRAMTRDGDAEAHLYVLLPRGLPALPVLPPDLFCELQDEYECGALIGRPGGRSPPPRLAELELERTPIAGVRLRHKVLLAARLTRPKLRRGDRRGLDAVLRTAEGFDPSAPCGLRRFRGLYFHHRLFSGRGQHLLEWLGHPATQAGYELFLLSACPDAIAGRLLRTSGMGEHVTREERCARELEALAAQLRARGTPAALEALADLAAGVCAVPPPPPDARLERLAEARWLDEVLSALPPRSLAVLDRRFGLAGEEPHTLDMLGQAEQVTRERVRAIALAGLRRLRRRIPDEAPSSFDFDWDPFPAGRRPRAKPSRRERAFAEDVLGSLRTERRPLAASELCARLDRQPGEVAAALLLLRAAGAVLRTADGYSARSLDGDAW